MSSPDNQCRCLTAAGTQCKRPRESDTEYCWQHEECKHPKTNLQFPGEKLPQDIILTIASMENLPVRTILNMCERNKRYRDLICNNKAFWIELAENRISTPRNQLEQMSIQDIQKRLHTTTLEKEIREHEGNAINIGCNLDDMFGNSTLFKENQKKYYQELDDIEVLKQDLSYLRRLYDELPHRGHIDVTIAPEEWTRYRDSYGTFRTEDYLHSKDFRSKYPPETLILISNPQGQPMTFYYVGSSKSSGRYEKYPDLPRPIREEMEKNLWTLDDLQYIYGLPK